MSKADLVGLETPTGPVSPASVYLLKHYYLGSQDALTADPGPPPRIAAVPEIPPLAAYSLQQILVGLPGMAIYGLMACAYALVFGLVGRINVAFGEIAAIGAAAAGVATALYAQSGFGSVGPGLVLGLGAGLAAAAIHNAVVGRIAFLVVPASRTQASLIATVGFSLALMEYLRLAGGTKPAWIPPVLNEPWLLAHSGDFLVTVTPIGLANAATGFTMAAVAVVLLRVSRFGREWRAWSQDRLAAALFGIDGVRLTLVTLALAGALAGLAGGLVAIQFGALGFADGFQLGLKALAASLLGGIGSVGGSFAGGLAIGLFETLWSAFLPIEARDLALYVVLIVTVASRSAFLAEPDRM